MNIVDLHVHSTKSDGSFTPTQLVDYALEKGLSAFALTDHDCVDGLDEAISYAKDKGVEVVPGIELSTEQEGRDIHILGLYIDHHSQSFQKHIQDFVASRLERNRKMCENLQNAGIQITYEALLERFPDAVITRSHYARYMMENGYIRNMKEAFDKYIGDRCPCFVPREKVTPVQAIKLILEADGIPVLAHPILYHLSDSKLDQLVSELKAAGLMGIEAVYSSYAPAEERQIRKLAKKYNLLITGGSDFHGANKPGLDLAVGYGHLFIPEEILSDLKKSRKKILFSDMDGTLLRSDNTISSDMKAAIDRLVQNGHRFVLSSGRPLQSMLNLCESLDLYYPGMLLIAFNGALVYDVDAHAALWETKLNCEDISYLLAAAKKAGLHCQGYTDTHIVSASVNEETDYYSGNVKVPVMVSANPADTLKDGSWKLLCIDLHNHQKLLTFRDTVKDYCGNRLQLIFSNEQYLEIFPADAGKGNAVSFVCDFFHIPLSHAYAAGDAQNDLSMLRAVGHGIAMANASEEVKATAETVTQHDNNHDGLLEILSSTFYN